MSHSLDIFVLANFLLDILANLLKIISVFQLSLYFSITICPTLKSYEFIFFVFCVLYKDLSYSYSRLDFGYTHASCVTQCKALAVRMHARMHACRNSHFRRISHVRIISHERRAYYLHVHLFFLCVQLLF
jgi:hypothetical protein